MPTVWAVGHLRNTVPSIFRFSLRSCRGSSGPPTQRSQLSLSSEWEGGWLGCGTAELRHGEVRRVDSLSIRGRHCVQGCPCPAWFQGTGRNASPFSLPSFLLPSRALEERSRKEVEVKNASGKQGEEKALFSSCPSIPRVLSQALDAEGLQSVKPQHGSLATLNPQPSPDGLDHKLQAS